MNGLYSLLLFLFIFGASVGYFNATHAFPNQTLPDAGYQISESTVTDLQAAGASQAANDFSVWSLIQIFMTSLGSGITALFLVGFVIKDFALMVGATPDFAAQTGLFIQAIVTFLTLWGLYELWTGRSVT